jgi:hypothetical protein
MRPTLEELKAMSDAELYNHWQYGHFPFEQLSSCGHCLTEHVFYKDSESMACREESHAEIVHNVDRRWRQPIKFGDQLRPHLAELYAARLFFDHLYTLEEQEKEALDVPEENEQQQAQDEEKVSV